MKKAVFYQCALMLIPDEFQSFDEFVQDIQSHPLQVLVTLHEKDCLAPYFIEEHCEIKAVMIHHPEELIETEVEVLPQSAYDELLENKMHELRIDRPLSSLRSCMTLDGTFLKESSNDCYHESIVAFWDAFMKKEAMLKESIGSFCEQNDELRMMLLDYCGIPYHQTRVYLRRIKNKSVLMISCLADSLVQILVDGIFHHVPSSLKGTWDFYSFLPKGLFQYAAVNELYDVSKFPCRLKTSKCRFDHLRYDIEIEIEPFDDFAFACEENYLYMCSVLGENLFHAVVHSFKWTKTRKKIGVSCEEFFGKLMSVFDPALFIQLNGHMHQIGLRLKKQESFSERSFEQHIMTRCIECTDWFILDKPSVDIDELQLQMNIAFSTLVFTLRDDEAKEIQQKHILLDLMKHLVENTSMEIIDYCISDGRIDVDFMNFDPALMFNELRKHAPFLSKYDCRYDVHTAEGVSRYEVSYQMKSKKLSFNQLN